MLKAIWSTRIAVSYEICLSKSQCSLFFCLFLDNDIERLRVVRAILKQKFGAEYFVSFKNTVFLIDADAVSVCGGLRKHQRKVTSSLKRGHA